MADLKEYVHELVEEVGPRPAGTEEEHRASELIAQRFLDFGLQTDVDEFSCSGGMTWFRGLYYGLSAVAAIVGFFFPNFLITALIIGILAVVMMVIDLLDKNPLSTLFIRNVSQNVVARHVPREVDGAPRRRKVIIVAHYDTARAQLQAAPFLVNAYPVLRWLVMGAMAIVMVFIFLCLLPLPEMVKTVLSSVSLGAGIVSLIALIFIIIGNFMPYSQGANDNASGVTTLFGIAERLTADPASRRVSQSAERPSGSRHSSRPDRSERPQRFRRSQRNEQASRSTVRGDTSVLEAGVVPTVPAEGDAGEVPKQTKSVADNLVDVFSGRSDYSSTGAADKTGDLSPNDATSDNVSVGAEDDASSGSNILHSTDDGLEEHATGAEGVSDRPVTKYDRPLALPEERFVGGVPSWYNKAKANAGKKERTSDEDKVVRSRFADVPSAAYTRPVHEEPSDDETEVTPVDHATEPRDVSKQPGQDEHESGTADTHTAPERQAMASDDGGAVFDDAGPDRKDVRAKDAKLGSTVSYAPIDTDSDDGHLFGFAEEVPSQNDSKHASVESHDFSGFEKPAFSVVSGVGKDGRSAIVPATDEVSVDTGHSKKADEAKGLRSVRARLQSRLPDLPAGKTGKVHNRQEGLDRSNLHDEHAFESDAPSSVNLTGSFAPLGATGVIPPIGDELLEHTSQEEIYVEDADDSSFDQSYNERGGYAGPDLVSMPESRVRSFFGNVGDKLGGKKKHKKEKSASEWLGVDEDFNAHHEGSSIGSWDNFSDDDENWKGGAFGGVDRNENEDAIKTLSDDLLDKEVWFVAVGASGFDHAGMKAFLDSYASQLRGALVVNVEAVGAGRLCFTSAEGKALLKNTDHRLQNLARKAAGSMGVDASLVKIDWRKTDATEALSRGIRAITVMGLDRKAPVGWHWSTDTVDTVEEGNLEVATEVLVEMIRNS